MTDLNQTAADAVGTTETVAADIKTAAAAPTNQEKAADAATGLADALAGGMSVLKDLGVIDAKLQAEGLSVASLIAVVAKVFAGVHL